MNYSGKCLLASFHLRSLKQSPFQVILVLFTRISIPHEPPKKLLHPWKPAWEWAFLNEPLLSLSPPPPAVFLPAENLKMVLLLTVAGRTCRVRQCLIKSASRWQLHTPARVISASLSFQSYRQQYLPEQGHLQHQQIPPGGFPTGSYPQHFAYPQQPTPPPPPPRRRWKRWAFVIGTGVVALGAAVAVFFHLFEIHWGPLMVDYPLLDVERPQILDPTEFRPFTLIFRGPVCPGSNMQILTVRPQQMPDIYSSDVASNYPGWWDQGLWHVEIKHPDIQVSRDYTPVLHLVTQLSRDEFAAIHREMGLQDRRLANKGLVDPYFDQVGWVYLERAVCDLNFLVRPLEGGLVSRYLCGLPVGSTVYLRGPHPGFDFFSHIGIRSLREAKEIQEARAEKMPHEQDFHDQMRREDHHEMRMVCIVGGTGISPALQAAQALELGLSSDEAAINNTILWGVRQSADLGNVPQPEEKLSQSIMADPELLAYPLRRLLGLMKVSTANFPDSYTLRWKTFVDEQGEQIQPEDIKRALTDRPPNWPPRKSLPVTHPHCPYHSRDSLKRSPESDLKTHCRCQISSARIPRKHILLVSGPPGFVEQIAGPKEWSDGKQLQGPVAGILGKLEEENPGMLDEWLVLKM